MHHGPAERPAVAAWALWLSYVYEVCRERRPSMHSLLTDLSFVLFHEQLNESITLIVRYTALPSCSGSSAFWSILKTSQLHSKEFNFYRITKHVNCIMLIVLTIVLRILIYIILSCSRKSGPFVNRAHIHGELPDK